MGKGENLRENIKDRRTKTEGWENKTKKKKLLEQDNGRIKWQKGNMDKAQSFANARR